MKKDKMVIRKLTDIQMTVKEFKNYKKEFNTLIDYKEKLSYFYEKFNGFVLNHFTIHSPECDNLEVAAKENYITIYPCDRIERETYFQWLYDLTSKVKFEEMTTLFEEKILQSPNKTLFFEREIERVKKEIAIYTGTSSQHKTKFHSSIYAAFKEGYNSRVEVRKINFSDDDFLKHNHDYHEVVRGSLFADYEGYLGNYQLDTNDKQLSKIKFTGKPSLFAYLILELTKNNLIEPPLRNGDLNYTGLAKLFMQHFDINGSEENIIKEFNPKKNTLSDSNRRKIIINL